MVVATLSWVRLGSHPRCPNPNLGSKSITISITKEYSNLYQLKDNRNSCAYGPEAIYVTPHLKQKEIQELQELYFSLLTLPDLLEALTPKEAAKRVVLKVNKKTINPVLNTEKESIRQTAVDD